MQDIDKLKKAVVFVVHVVNKVDEITQDGFQWLPDTMSLVPTLIEIPGIIKDADEISEELNDLTMEELDELKEVVKAEFDLKDDELEFIIEDAVDLLKATADFAIRVKTALKKK